MIINEYLFVSGRDQEDTLKKVAYEILALLNIDEIQERYSSNYPPDEHYFVGYTENVVVRIYDADDARTPEYPYLISFKEPTYRKGNEPFEMNIEEIALVLSKNDFKVFTPYGEWWSIEWDGKGKIHTA